MTVKDIADDITAMLRAGQADEAGEKYWAADVVSIEAMPGDMAEVRGVEGVRAKGEWWTSAHEVHAMEVEGPYLNGDQFAVRMKMDLTVKETGERITMDEIGLYTIRDGKIAEERFFY
ncbi:SnoaL-like domain-containing protein [Phenylobacterium sp.]|uniref:SnoaL-like domain-containing protein n=1 Tax=Phenylobacterium sp. TaxID=1871053 RepID=UPI0035B35440